MERAAAHAQEYTRGALKARGRFLRLHTHTPNFPSRSSTAAAVMGWSVGAVAVGVACLLLLLRSFYPYFWKDLLYYVKVRRAGRQMMAGMRRGVVTYLQRFELQARTAPDKPFLLFETQIVTYGDADERSNKFANVLKSHCGLRRGDVVALLMENETDFVCVWFGLSKLGCEVAFLNSNVRSRSLEQCVRRCGARALVVGADLSAAHTGMLQTLQDGGVSVWVTSHSDAQGNTRTLLDKLATASAEKPEVEEHQPELTSTFLLIFTSGTTGLPKAARVSHIKAVMCMSFLRMCGAEARDRVYVTLPLYHMSASLLGLGGCIHLGATCVLKRKFSARHFWSDCVKYDISVFQYVGELCRYLLHQPQTAEEASHNVRLAAGSGLRSDVWREFVRRFPKVRVREAYGLTEASVGFLNYTDHIGPIGRASYFNKMVMPFELVQCDLESCTALRTDEGRCTRVNRGEAGLLVAPVTFTNPFLGYVGDEVMSDRKLLRDVFRKGDLYFNTGDLMMQDPQDFIYFKDRLGDTFRWKGENVSTTEVSEALGCLDFLQDVTVYGVTVPGCEGRAGMAAVVLREGAELDGERLCGHMLQTLPAYAWPLFLRLQSCLDVTETFKQQKSGLVQEGFDPHVVQQPLYFLKPPQRSYVPLTAHVYQDIISGLLRL